jgi:hypothetical protein
VFACVRKSVFVLCALVDMSGYFAEDRAIKGILGVKYWIARGAKGGFGGGGRGKGGVAYDGNSWLLAPKKPTRRLISRVTQLWEPSRRICRGAI